MVVEREDHRVILNENCGNSERRSTVVKNRIDALEDFRKQLEGADVDLLREMVKIFAERLLEPRRRAERAFVQVVAECYVRGVSTRRVEGLVRQLGIERISRSRVSEMATELDRAVEAFRTRPLDSGPTRTSGSTPPC